MDYEESASKIMNQLSDACGDVAHQTVNGINTTGMVVPDCEDKEGAVADILYNDVKFINGFMPDYIWNEAPGSEQHDDRIAIANALKGIGHDAIKTVAESLITTWNAIKEKVDG